jgi:hypothetical protein
MAKVDEIVGSLIVSRNSSLDRMRKDLEKMAKRLEALEGHAA